MKKLFVLLLLVVLPVIGTSSAFALGDYQAAEGVAVTAVPVDQSVMAEKTTAVAGQTMPIMQMNGLVIKVVSYGYDSNSIQMTVTNEGPNTQYNVRAISKTIYGQTRNLVTMSELGPGESFILAANMDGMKWSDLDHILVVSNDDFDVWNNYDHAQPTPYTLENRVSKLEHRVDVIQNILTQILDMVERFVYGYGTVQNVTSTGQSSPVVGTTIQEAVIGQINDYKAQLNSLE